MESIGNGPGGNAATLIGMAQMARHAKSIAELQFMAVNGSHALAPYRQAALSLGNEVRTLSGVVQIEANAPYVHWLKRLCASLTESGRVNGAGLAGEVGEEWEDWLPAYGLWIAFDLGEQAGGRGGLLLARDIPWLDSEIDALTEWMDVWQHAYRAALPRQAWSLSALMNALRTPRGQDGKPAAPWWRRRGVQVGAAAAIALCIPVRLTVLASGELVPAHPAVVRSPLDGVIEHFHVKPNQSVRKGEPLFDFDEAQLASRYAVAVQALATAEAEYRQSAQQALSDSRSKVQLTSLQGKIEERRAETEFLRGQVERAQVLAPRDGMVLLDDPGEWIGRPVSTGERVLHVADPTDVEVEAWLAVGDAIPLAAGDPVTLYLSASPLKPVSAAVRYASYDAVQRPDGTYAYRVRAALDEPTGHRVGLKGTAKLTGRWVPAAYWIFRRPIAAIRQVLGW